MDPYYVDGFVLPVKEGNVEAYKKMASEAGELWMKHGALAYFECVGDELSPDSHGMPMTKFPEGIQAKEGETVAFSFIIYKSKEHRDEVNKKVMGDPAMKDMDCDPEKIPFEMGRMMWGGFKPIVSLMNKEQ